MSRYRTAGGRRSLARCDGWTLTLNAGRLEEAGGMAQEAPCRALPRGAGLLNRLLDLVTHLFHALLDVIPS